MPARTLLAAIPIALLATAAMDFGRGGEPLPVVEPNDNRQAGGRMHEGVYTIRLVVREARWFPEGEDGPSVVVPAFAEEGAAPRIPGPLIRVPAGTAIVATVRNELPDSTITVYGLEPHPVSRRDSLVLPPGASATVRFPAGDPGTFIYAARSTRAEVETEQLAGAFVVDSTDTPPDDRIFVINIWGEERDSMTYRNALAINGRSWPHTERIQAQVGDTLRWRVVNASLRPHPMHLHGFYFRLDSRGGPGADTAFAREQRPLMVTQTLLPRHTMALTWSPEREGNWLFHCHLSFHVVPATRLEPPHGRHHDLSGAAEEHMAGLVLGINVHPRAGDSPEVRENPRRLRLFVQEGPRRGRAPRSMGFVLQQGVEAPAPDSVEIPGSPLVLTRGEPTDIVVINRLPETTQIHWHGIELESWSDGVAGWSGAPGRVAPAIAPGDSFTARLTLKRAGTFIYHTHMNDIEQITSGLYGGIVVLEPGRRLDPSTDHLFVLGWDGDEGSPETPPHQIVNGDSLPPPLVLTSGTTHRLRFVNIGPAAPVRITLRRDTSLMSWKPAAKDGADLPPAQAIPQPAVRILDVGETFDALFTPPGRGDYTLSLGLLRPGIPPGYVRRVIVR